MPKSIRVALCRALAIALVWPSAAHAQDPAQEGPDPPTEPPAEEVAEDPDLWRVLVDVTYSGSAGNQTLSFFDGGVRVTRLQPDAVEFEMIARGRTGSDDGERVAENYTMSLKADAFPGARVSPFVFGSAESDRFRQLDLRTNAGGGVKYAFLRRPKSEVSLSLAVLHNREDFRTPDTPTHTDGRLSLRFKGAHEIREGVRVENVSFYQSVWDVFDDYLMQSENILSVQVFSMIAVTSSYVFQRDSTPQPGVESDDHHVKLGIQVQL